MSVYLVPALDNSQGSVIFGSIAASDYTPDVGDSVTLTFTDTSPDAINNTYQWYTGNNVLISGETTNVYVWTAAATSPPKIKVTSLSGQIKTFTVNVTTNPPAVTPPVNTGLPVITGTPTEGNILSGSDGTWSGSAAVYTYQWLRDGANISGANSNTYTPVSADVGTDISFRVNASNIAGSASATSTSVGPVSPITSIGGGRSYFGWFFGGFGSN